MSGHQLPLIKKNIVLLIQSEKTIPVILSKNCHFGKLHFNLYFITFQGNPLLRFLMLLRIHFYSCLFFFFSRSWYIVLSHGTESKPILLRSHILVLDSFLTENILIGLNEQKGSYFLLLWNLTQFSSKLPQTGKCWQGSNALCKPAWTVVKLVLDWDRRPQHQSPLSEFWYPT